MTGPRLPLLASTCLAALITGCLSGAAPGEGGSTRDASAGAPPATGDPRSDAGDSPSAHDDAASATDAAATTAVGDGSASGSSRADGGGAQDAGGDGSADPFVLSWRDDFDTLDPAAWELESFTYAGNLAQFTPQNAAVAGGVLTIGLTPNPASAAEPYFGVEMRSTRTLTYGKVSASMRFAHGSGVVSGLVLFYVPFPNCNWNEIDIEHLGDSPTTSQLNTQVFTGTVVPGCVTSVTPTQDPLIVNLGADAEAAFHRYDIAWTPSGVTTSIDGTVLRTWTKLSALLDLPQTILLTIWASSAAGWAGAVQPTSAPTSADVDWIEVYDWRP